jgi:hypothetical protein
MLKPWWARALTSAAALAVVVAAGWWAHGLAAYPHHSWLFSLAQRLAVIVTAALLVAALTSRSHRAYTNALVRVDPARRSAAIGASARGPVPADEATRKAAIRIAGVRLRSARRWRVWFSVLLSLAVLRVALDWSSDWKGDDWVDYAVILGLAAGTWYVSLSAGRRLQTLRQAVDPDR